MPNHVDQDLFVTGDVVTIKEFMEFAKDGKRILSADKFIPYPKIFKDKDEEAERIRLDCVKSGEQFNYEIIKDGFNSGGYEWCVENWGTKWGFYNESIKLSKLTGKKGKVVYNCNSAWSPGIKIVFAMSEKFPSLNFKLKHYERGSQLKGVFIVENCEIIENSTNFYSGKRGG